MPPAATTPVSGVSRPILIGPVPWARTCVNEPRAARPPSAVVEYSATVDLDNGLPPVPANLVARPGGSFDIVAAAAANTEVVKAKRNAIAMLKLGDHIEDILITLGKQYHLIRPMEKTPSVFMYVALDRKAANLGMARVQVKNVEQTLSF